MDILVIVFNHKMSNEQIFLIGIDLFYLSSSGVSWNIFKNILKEIKNSNLTPNFVDIYAINNLIRNDINWSNNCNIKFNNYTRHKNFSYDIQRIKKEWEEIQQNIH